MQHPYRYFVLVFLLFAGCSSPADPPADSATALETYVATPDPAYSYEAVSTLEGEGFTQHVLRMTSQEWLTTNEVEASRERHGSNQLPPPEVETFWEKLMAPFT